MVYIYRENKEHKELRARKVPMVPRDQVVLQEHPDDQVYPANRCALYRYKFLSIIGVFEFQQLKLHIHNMHIRICMCRSTLHFGIRVAEERMVYQE